MLCKQSIVNDSWHTILSTQNNMNDIDMGIGPQNKVTDSVCIDFLSWVQTGLNPMTKIRSLAFSEPKYNLGRFISLWLAEMATNGHFGHSGQSEVSANGPNGFPMPKNLGIDTKIKSLACSEPKLQFRHFYLPLTGWNGNKWPFWPLRLIRGVWK